VMRVGSGQGGADDCSGVGDILCDAGPLLVRSLASPTRYTLVCFLYVVTSGRPGASKSV
jgi:hypothetical protein